MKYKEKKLARVLRKRGYSLNEICIKTGSSKASVSVWVRDVILSRQQKQRLLSKGIGRTIVEKRRATRLANENIKREIIIDTAKKEINKVLKRELFLIGVALYWAEGSKTRRGVVQFANGDPRLIKLIMQFFRQICKISNKEFRGYIHIHPRLNVKKAENYWSLIAKVPLHQFYKTYKKQNKATKNKKDSLPYGTFTVSVYDTNLFLKIRGWMKGICVSANIPF